MKRRWFVFGVVIAMAGLTGCSLGAALLLPSKPQMVSINSQPSAATVVINGTTRGYTPLSVPLPIRGQYVVRVEKPGYVAIERSLHPSVGMDGSSVRLESNIDVVLQPITQGG